MDNHLTMPLWQQILLLMAIPLVVGMGVVWWKLRTLGRQGSSRPLRKRKRRRH